jgi:crotonobetainyl-CoA:carnitine CoA-transferase CaiB-like acyl-CoA transferase
MPRWCSPTSADVVRVRRPGGLQIPAEELDLLHRGKRIVDLDVKSGSINALVPGFLSPA